MRNSSVRIGVDWGCEWISECLDYVSNELWARGLLRSWDVNVLRARDLRLCSSCRSRKRKSPRKCRGWSFSFRGRNALTFRSLCIGQGPEVLVALEGKFSTERGSEIQSEWSGAPMSKCNVFLLIYDSVAKSGDPISRQHLDLANLGQPGPVWHLQLGGVGWGSDKEKRAAVQALRWPTLPMDFMLSVELCLYLFFFEEWNALRYRSTWIRYVKESERLILSQYASLLNSYLGQPSRASSWLAAQCNRTGILDPRPM